MKSKPKWICCQIGAREHYAIPRALLRLEQLDCLITDYWSDGGLASQLTNRLASQLKSRTHDDIQNELVHHFNGGFLKLEADFRLKKRTGWDAIVRRNDWFKKTAAKKIESILETSTADVVFSYSYGAKQIFEVAKPLGKTLVLGQIDPGPFEWQLVDEIHRCHRVPPLEMPPAQYWDDWRAECELADVIIANSNWARQALVKQDIPEQKIRVVPLAYQIHDDVRVKHTEPPPETFSKDRPLRLLYLGQVIARKGVIELAAAIESLNGEPVELTIVGGGDSSLLGRFKELPNVNVTGQVDRDTAVEYYQQADVFILPTHSDGFAITLLEAAAFGLPIIASPFCGDVVRDELDGVVLEEVSTEAIVKAVGKLISDAPLVRRFQKEQRQRKFRTIDDLANELTKLKNK